MLSCMVEVDTSDTRVRAIYLIWQSNLSKLYQCAFNSSIVYFAECKYNVQNWELLTIKLPLKVWSHWLKGTCIHLEYWQIATTLCTFQQPRDWLLDKERRALFILQINLNIFWHPRMESKNRKADAFSKGHEKKCSNNEGGTLIPGSCTLAHITREIGEEI